MDRCKRFRMKINIFYNQRFYIRDSHYPTWLRDNAGSLFEVRGSKALWDKGFFLAEEDVDWNKIRINFNSGIRTIDVSPNLKVNDLLSSDTAISLGLLPRKRKANLFEDRKFVMNDLPKPVAIYYPPSKEPLPLDATLSELGVVEGDILFYCDNCDASDPDCQYSLVSAPDPSEIFKRVIVDDINADSAGCLKGIFLYTDEDIDLVRYVREHFHDLDRMTGDWCVIHLLEKPQNDWKSIRDYWRPILHSNLYQMWSVIRWITTKPFDKSESYTVARRLGVDFSHLPCLVILPANAEDFARERLVFPIKDVSTQYFRKLFSSIEKIIDNAGISVDVNSSANQTLEFQNYRNYEKYYEETRKNLYYKRFRRIQIDFNRLTTYLNETTSVRKDMSINKYEFEGHTIFFVGNIEEVNMGSESSKHQNFNFSGSVGNVNTGDVTIRGDQVGMKHIYTSEKSLADAAIEIHELLNQLSLIYPSETETEKRAFVTRAITQIRQDPTMVDRAWGALKAGSIEAVKAIANHPAVSIPVEVVKGWIEAEPNIRQ
jgi:hypothetical protein